MLVEFVKTSEDDGSQVKMVGKHRMVWEQDWFSGNELVYIKKNGDIRL